MRISKIFLAALLTFGSAAGWAQNKGGIDPKMLGELRDSYKNTAEDKALRNALAGTDIQKLASNADVRNYRSGVVGSLLAFFGLERVAG